MASLRAVRWTAWTLGAAAAIVCGLASSPVSAQCAVQPEEGSWVNLNPNTRSVTQVRLRFTCQDQVLNGQPYPPGPPWHVHVFGRCHPTDCDWGEVGAQRLNNGEIFSTYNQGFASRAVHAQMSQQQPDTLQLIIHTDFTNPNRRDYDINQLFRRQP
jgi:hypothetical protein